MSQAPNDEGVVIGVDVGGTKTQAVCLDPSFDVVTAVKASTLTGGEDQVVAGIVDTVASLQANGRSLAGVGIGLPGVVDASAGSVRHAFNLGIGDDAFDIVSRLSPALNAPCWIANDVDVAALGAYEILRRGDPGLGDLAYLNIGTGIAAGVILGGRIYRGRNGFAGEIGHLPADPSGPLCACGLRGCLESVASGAALDRQWPPPDPHATEVTVFTAARSGDEKAKQVVQRAVGHLATAVRTLALTFDVSCIVIGGGVADIGGAQLMNALRQELRGLDRLSAYARALDLANRITLKPSEPVGAIGAAALAFRHRAA